MRLITSRLKIIGIIIQNILNLLLPPLRNIIIGVIHSSRTHRLFNNLLSLRIDRLLILREYSRVLFFGLRIEWLPSFFRNGKFFPCARTQSNPGKGRVPFLDFFAIFTHTCSSNGVVLPELRVNFASPRIYRSAHLNMDVDRLLSGDIVREASIWIVSMHRTQISLFVHLESCLLVERPHVDYFTFFSLGIPFLVQF